MLASKYFLAWPAIFLSALFMTGFQTNAEKKPGQGFAVVELFTSEGCSSCPPADEAVIDIAKKYKNNVFVLGFHVDYWNYLGWKDVFSNAGYSKRQQQYGAAFSLNSIYTPQIIVNGKTEFVGSDKTRLQQTIAKELNTVAISNIELSARQNGSNSISVDVKTENTPNTIIHIALVQLHAQSDVTRGENEGRLLHHINVVRDFKTLESNKDHAVYLDLPAGLSKKDCSVIGLVQDKNTFHITAAVSTAIQ
jgi:hypothetical protein